MTIHVSIRSTRSFLLLISLVWLLCPVAVRAQPAAPRSADEVLAHVNTLVAARNFAGAITLLENAITRYPTQTRLYLTLADLQESVALSAMGPGATPQAFRRGLNQPRYQQLAHDLFETYGRGCAYAADIRPIERRVTELVATQYPVVLGEFGPLALPGALMPSVTTLIDPLLPTEARGAYQGLITTRPLPVTPPYVRDPKYGADPAYARHPIFGRLVFRHKLLAYAYDREQRVWRLHFRIMWQDAPGHADARARAARQTGMLMLRLSTMLQAYTGLTARFAEDGAVNLWMTERGDAGGETYDENIYLYAVGYPRSPTEWVRQLAHEYGHETLPPVGGYVEPEWGANGPLGERLFMRWLLLNRDPHADSHPWVQALDPVDVREERVGTVIRHFAAHGPEAQIMYGVNAAAMDGFVGMAAYLEITRGSRYLAAVLNGISSPAYGGPLGFLETLTTRETFHQEARQALVHLRLHELPPGIPLWVYLRDGVWQGTVDQGANPAPLRVEVNGQPIAVAGDAFTTPTLQRGWHRITLATTVNAAPTLNSLALVRQ